MQNVDTTYVFTMVLPYIKIGEVGLNLGTTLKSLARNADCVLKCLFGKRI